MFLLRPILNILLFAIGMCQVLFLDVLEAIPGPLVPSPHIHKQPTPTQKFLVPIPHVMPFSGMEGVDCIYVVNLESRPKKWERVQQICKEYDIFPSRVNAVDGTTLPPQGIKELFGPYPTKIKRGQIGCLLSHVSIFLDSYRRQLNCAWICEDDIDFLGNPLQMPELLKELTEIDPNWDILYTDPESTVPIYYSFAPLGTPIPNLGSDFRPDQHHHPHRDYLLKEKINAHFTRIGQRYGTYSYFVSKKGIKKLMDYFLHVYLWTAIDIDLHYVPDIREYALNTPLISHWIYSETNDTWSKF